MLSLTKHELNSIHAKKYTKYINHHFFLLSNVYHCHQKVFTLVIELHLSELLPHFACLSHQIQILLVDGWILTVQLRPLLT